ncbi:hypothetical protein BYT27DRAFT_7253995 [Phlegmacium glaucopus]|nr:hypothetical protein BYT27DRAFT_7253995 [Phlegmacium glaucopus]
MAIVVGSRGNQPVKGNSPEAEVSDGKTITMQGIDRRLYEYDPTNIQSQLRYTEIYNVKASNVAYCPLDPELFIVGLEDGPLEVTLGSTIIQLNPSYKVVTHD